MTGNPLEFVPADEIASRKRDQVFVFGKNKNIVCVTDDLGPQNETLSEIVVGGTGATPGIFLWANSSTLRWRFNEVSMRAFARPAAAKAAIEALFDEAVGKWDRACPVKFKRDDKRWDFEVVVRSQERCSANGCVLASAFFPDGGQHKLTIYPTMFKQPRDEQIETLIHEIGHIFGLRHYFALISETDWPAEVVGTHSPFSIMNYGDPSRLTDADKTDLKNLYEKVWAGDVTEINGTPIKLMKPFTAKRA